MFTEFQRYVNWTGRQSVLALMVVLLTANSLQAKTLYVSGVNGNDSVTYAANSAANPWRTIGRASWGSTNRDAPVSGEAARAGDVVLIEAGIYTAPGSNSRNFPSFMVSQSGQPGAPIVFRATGRVELRLSSGFGSTIGAFYQNHIIWDGFTIHEATAPSSADTGAANIWGCDGCQFLNLDINGNGNANARGDNHTGIRIEGSKNILIRGNRIQNVYSAANANNGACIMTYSSGGLTLEHNELFDCGAGIFLKGGGNHPNNDYRTIRYNLIYNTGAINGSDGSAIALHGGAGGATADRPVLIYQNVIAGAVFGVRFWMFDSVDPLNNPVHVKFVNNTIYNTTYGTVVTSGTFLSGSANVFKGNIVVASRDHAFYSDPIPSNVQDKGRYDSEHNLYFSYPFFAVFAGNDEYTLATWKTSLGQDNAAPGSVNADPLFVNAGARDFRLQPGSPAFGLSRDVLDLNRNGITSDTIPAGAYVTGNEIIGRTNSPPSPVPSAPTNLRIIG